MAGKVCQICGAENNKYDLCRDCYYEIEDYVYEMEETFSKQELIDYYNNLKYYIFKIKNEEYENSAYMKLVALAKIYENEYNSKTLINNVYKEIASIKEKKQNFKNKQQEKTQIKAEKKDLNPIEDLEEIDQDTLDYRLLYPMQHHCDDGHYVRSPYEQQIDDFLTSEGIIHYYEKRLKNYDTGETYYPDWYLPTITNKGVYIECFGLNDEKYKEKTERKLNFYTKIEMINLIEVYPKHMKNFKEYLSDKIEEYKRKK